MGPTTRHVRRAIEEARTQPLQAGLPKAVVDCSHLDRLLRERNALRDALQRLYDEQNDAPLERHREAWEAAMKEASEALAAAPEDTQDSHEENEQGVQE